MNRFCSYKFTLVIAFCLCIVQTVYAQDFDKKMLIDRFDELDNAINNGEGYSKSTNEAGTLAWAESYLLEAYLDMYEATGDKRYIKKFLVQADQVMSNTDKARGIKDYKGRARTGWSATKYTKNNLPMVYIVHSGMILFPIVKFCYLVKSKEELPSFMDVADRYTKFVEEAVYEFEGQWRFDPKTGEGSYWFEGDEPMETNLKAPMPFNGPLAMGRVLIMLYNVTSKAVYLDKAKALAQHFKNNLILREGNYYIWGYRPNLKKYPQMEDISHGAIDVDFAVLAFRNGIVFEKIDIDRFVNTLLNAKKRAKRFAFSKFVDGSEDPEGKPYSNAPTDVSDAVGRWLELSFWNCKLYDVVFDYITEKVKESKKEHPQVMLGIAKLAKYWGVCRNEP